MKTATEFGPWTMSAHDCRMNSFWKKRLVALQGSKARRTSRSHRVGLMGLLVLVIGMPSWQLGEQTAIAQVQPSAMPPEDTPIVAARPATGTQVSPVRQAPVLPRVGPKDGRPWQLVDSSHLPATNKIVITEGKHLNLDMPKGGEYSTSDSAEGIFSVTVDETTGDALIRGVKSGVGSFKYSKGERKKVEFQIVVVSDPAPLKAKLEQAGRGHIRITPGVQSVTLSGDLATPEELQQSIALAEELYPHVVNNIQIRNPQQVQLNCKIFEFKTTEEKLEGVLDALFRNGERQSNAAGIYSSLFDGKVFNTKFEEFRKTVEAKMLAEPGLVTTSGRPAAFRAGGEFPILIPQAPGLVAVEYKQFGTRVDFVPTVLKDERIHLEMRPQVSQLMHDKEYAVEVDGVTIPALRQRSVDVAADMAAGQTMMAVVVHENDKGQKVGLVSMVQPSLISRKLTADGSTRSAVPMLNPQLLKR